MPVVSVPTAVRLEVVTPLPSVLPLRTEVPAILKSLPLARSTCSLKVQDPVALSQLMVLSVAPLSVIPPPFAVTSVGVATEPNSMFLSSTVTVVLFTVVVVPLTVRLPATVKLSDQLTSVPSVTKTWLAVPFASLLTAISAVAETSALTIG